MKYLDYASLSIIAGLALSITACRDGDAGADDGGASSTTSDGTTGAASTTGESASTTSGTTSGTTEDESSTDTETDPGESTGTETGESTGTETGESTGAETDEEPLAACHALPEAEAAQWVEGPSSEPSGESTPERIETAGARTWELALDLLRVTASEGSMAMSPTAMSLASSMTYRNYVGEECGDQIHAAMHFSEEGEALFDTWSASLRTLQARARPGSEGADPVALEFRPSIWVFEEAPEEPRIDPTFGATVHYASGDLAAAREVMNCVIEQQSGGLLTNFLPEGYPRADTTTMELGVSFLQAPWATAMERRGDIDFELPSGEVEARPSVGSFTMPADVYQSEDWLSIELPLRDEELAVMLITPQRDAGITLGALTEALTPADVELALGSASRVQVDFRMPLVNVPATVVDYYPLLGLDCPLFTLRTMLHGAALEIDEKGIKAAAASANENWESSGVEDVELEIVLDRPFLIFVYDRATQFVLFSGRFEG